METKGSLLLIFVGFIFEKYDFFGSCSVLLLLWILNLRSFVESLFCGVVFPILSGDLDLFVGLSGSDSCLCVSLDVLVEEDVEDEVPPPPPTNPEPPAAVVVVVEPPAPPPEIP